MNFYLNFSYKAFDFSIVDAHQFCHNILYEMHNNNKICIAISYKHVYVFRERNKNFIEVSEVYSYF